MNEDHPCILFIDDIHWIDPATAQFINFILNQNLIRHFLLLLTQRSEDPIRPESDLKLDKDSKIKHIDLHPISANELKEWMEDIFQKNCDNLDLYSHLVHQHTLGNPLLSYHHLLELFYRNLINFDWKIGKWQWDINALKNHKLTEGALESVKNQVKYFTSSSQELLKILACFGSKIKLATLANISKKDLTQIEHHLVEPLQEKLIFRLDTDVHFVHDSIRQTIYGMISSSERQFIHLKIGRSLLVCPVYDVFQTADQFNLGLESIEENEKLKIIQLNLEASK
jgi:predicted ATPase